MATLRIRNLDDAMRDRLRRRAADHGHSMEEEVGQILRQVVKPGNPTPDPKGLGSRIHDHFDRLGELELELPPGATTHQRRAVSRERPGIRPTLGSSEHMQRKQAGAFDSKVMTDS